MHARELHAEDDCHQGDVRLRVETEKKLVGLGRKILAAAETLNLSEPQPDQGCPHAVFA
jgi:hypothetical protein